MELIIFNSENAASHKYVVHTPKSLLMARSEMTGCYFLLSKNHINSILKIPVANFCRFITTYTYPGHGRCVASWNFNSVWFVDPTFPESNSKVILKVCMKLLALVWNYSVCSQISEHNPLTRPRVLNTSVPSCWNECSKVNIGQYVKPIMT